MQCFEQRKKNTGCEYTRCFKRKLQKTLFRNHTDDRAFSHETCRKMNDNLEAEKQKRSSRFGDAPLSDT